MMKTLLLAVMVSLFATPGGWAQTYPEPGGSTFPEEGQVGGRAGTSDPTRRVGQTGYPRDFAADPYGDPSQEDLSSWGLLGLIGLAGLLGLRRRKTQRG
jgi:MYXO-CTERM domain-containing protein